jgi:RNA polymerase primary sigma factor
MNKKKNQENDVKILNNYFRDIKKNKLLTPEQEVELAIRIKDGDESAVEELVRANLRFVITIAKDYKDNGVGLADLISEGNYGLVKAAKRFDHTKGFRFISYAVWWIKQSILQYLNEHSRTIRLPVNILTKIYQLKKELDDYDLETQNIDSDDFELLNKYPTVGSLNHIIGEDQQEISHYLRDDDPNKSYEEMREEDVNIKEDIKEFLDTLEEREREILIYYYGLSDSGETMTLETIGDIYGLTKERVRQIKGKAIKKLRANVPAIIKLSN